MTTGKLIRSSMDDRWEHGKVSTYTNHGCRCARCKEAQRINQRNRRKKIYPTRHS